MKYHKSLKIVLFEVTYHILPYSTKPVLKKNAQLKKKVKILE